jgi:hypothetical protein
MLRSKATFYAPVELLGFLELPLQQLGHLAFHLLFYRVLVLAELFSQGLELLLVLLSLFGKLLISLEDRRLECFPILLALFNLFM